MDTSNNSTTTLQPLVSPPKEERPVNKTSKVSYKVILVACFVLIVATLLFFFFNQPVQADKYIVTENKEAMTRETRLNFAAGLVGREQLPLSFPKSVPVELEWISESLSIYYIGLEKTEYVVSYITTESVDSKYKEYKEFMENNEYILTEFAGSRMTESSAILHGVKGEIEMYVTIYRVPIGSVDINVPEERTMVQIKYIDKTLPAVE